MSSDFFPILTHHTHLHRNKRKRRLALLLLLCAIPLGTPIFGAPSGAPSDLDIKNLKVVVAVNPNKLYSTAVWTAVTNSQKELSFLRDARRFDYIDESTLLSMVQDEINNLSQTDYLLLFGPAKTGEALMLEHDLTNVPNKQVFFISPTISTTNSYNRIQLIKACLPDIERVQRLRDVRPPSWNSLPATYIGVNNPWGVVLEQTLQAVQTNICQSL